MHHEAQFNSKGNNKNKYKKLSCPKCNSENIIRRGFRKTENRGKIQGYKCKNCNFRFVLEKEKERDY
jgi:transposase-like protein